MTQVRPTNNFTAFNEADVEQSLIRRFETMVDRYPDRLALKDSCRQLTYQSLNESANQVAFGLLDRSRTSAQPVGLLLGNDALAVTAVIGVLKAGSAYVSLDSSLPFNRLKSIVEHARITTVLTNRKNEILAKKLSGGAINFFIVEDLKHAGKAHVSLPLSADTLAAVFYTSGSTGEPKGVMQSHRNVLHRVMIDTNEFHLHPHDRMSLLSSPSYSVSLRNLFGALLNGAAVCPFDIEAEGINALVRWLTRDQITIYFSVPSVFRQVAANVTKNDDLTALRLVCLGGEPVRRTDVDLYKRSFASNCLFVNSLASNETGVYRNYFIDKETAIEGNLVPCGYAVPDKELSLRDAAGREIDSGEIGEIVIRSRYLSPGYWRNRELTTAVFKPDPEDPVARIYHTGDLGYRRSDGCLSYVGRKDFRTKIHGIRVELQEVEAVILQHPDIQDAAVIVGEPVEQEDARLTAYVEPKRERKIELPEIHRFLTNRLPGHMLPSGYVILDALPRIANGKLDRNALCRSSGILRPRKPYVPPTTAVESELVRLWEVVFKLCPIGTNEDFFDLGGDSLLALRLTVHVEKSFKKHFPPASLYQARTIAQLAQLIETQPNSQASSSLVPIQPYGLRSPFFWIHGDNSNAVLPSYLGCDQPIYGIEHQSQDGQAARYDRVETIAAAYVEQIQTVQSTGPYFIGGYSFGAVVAFEIAKQLKKSGEQTRLLFLLDPPELDFFATSSPAAVSKSGCSETYANGNITDHLRQLSKLQTKQMLGYVSVRVFGRISGVVLQCKRRMDKALRKMVSSVCLVSGLSLPCSVRSSYILNIYSRALRTYSPSPYSGTALLIRTPARSPGYSKTWSRVISGGVALYEVPGDHMMLRQEPYVSMWAQTLAACLSKAQELVCGAVLNRKNVA